MAMEIDPALLALVTTDSLVDTGRTSRKPMISWFHELENRLDAVEKSGPLGRPEEFSAVQNNFSLLTMLLAGTDAARAECMEQVRFAVNHGLLDEAVQPWVNLARLDRIEGWGRRSGRMLAPVLRLARTGRVRIGGVTFLATIGQRRFAANVYASEKFHLQLGTSGDLNRHLKLLESLFGRPEHPLLAEQQIVGGVRLNDHDLIHRGLSSKAWFTDARTRLVGMFYRAIWALGSGNREAADRFARELLLQTSPGKSGNPPDHSILRLLFRGAMLMAFREDPEKTVLLLERTLFEAARLQDAEYRVKAALELDRLEIASDWRGEAIASGYAAFREVPPFRATMGNEAEEFRLRLKTRIHAVRAMSRTADTEATS